MGRQDLQHIVGMLELELPCKSALGQRLGTFLYHLTSAWPKTMDGWWSSNYEDLVIGLKVEHFGEGGTRFALKMLEITEAPAEFSTRALQEIHQHSTANPRPSSKLACAGLALGRSAVFIEYDLDIGRHSPPLSGSHVQEHATTAGGGAVAPSSKGSESGLTCGPRFAWRVQSAGAGLQQGPWQQWFFRACG